MSKTKVLADAVSNGSILATALETNDGVIHVANGGTGLRTPGPVGNILTSNGTGWVSTASTIMPLADVEALALAGL
jgi:hypothetical protein